MLSMGILSVAHALYPNPSLVISDFRVKRFPEKVLVLLDNCLPKGTLPALISSRPSIQTERVSKQRFLSSYFVRLLELMPVFLSGIRYDFR